MTDDQVNRVVQHLCEQLHLALRLKGSEAHPPNAKDIGFRTRLCENCIADRVAFGGCHDPQRGSRCEQRAASVLKAKRGTEAPRQCLSWVINGPQAASKLGPLIPGQRTCSDYFSMSVSCQKRTDAARHCGAPLYQRHAQLEALSAERTISAPPGSAARITWASGSWPTRCTPSPSHVVRRSTSRIPRPP